MPPTSTPSDPLLALLALRELPRRHVIGLMSGTSADGIDAAIVAIDGHGPGLAVELLHFETVALRPQLRRRIWALPDATTGAICELDFLLGEAFGRAALTATRHAGLKPHEVHLVGSHGQTARHHPPGTPGRIPSTLQLAEGAVIAEQTGLPTICDFRVADMAAGGHGAPLIPLIDHLLFGGRKQGAQVLLNLGGIANLTVVDERLDDVIAFDTGPANMALDAVARAASGGHDGFDRDGALARSGQVDESLLAELLRHPYFASSPPKSTGRETFGRDFAYPLLDRHGARLPDLAATLAALTVESIALALERWVLPGRTVQRMLVSGGGVHNPVLLEGLQRRLAPLPVASLASAGVDPDAKEAVGFAMLANETLFGAAGNVPAATGARGPRVLGKICLPSVR